jgi:hypothetical protein
LSFFWVAVNSSSALDFADFNISRILCFGSRRHGRDLLSRSAGWSASSATAGRFAPLLFYCSLYLYGVEGMKTNRSACLLRSVGRSLKAASPTASGCRPQPKLGAAPCVVSRPRTGSRRKICRSVRAEVHRRPSALP